MDDLRIVPTAEWHVAGFHRCVDAVARERCYLGVVEAPAVEASRSFVRDVLAEGGVHLVALDAAGEVVGWCDVKRHTLEGFRHGGRLGIGLLPALRGRGLGRALMTAALAAARARDFERVELDVFASNARAIALYEAMGFVHEGVRRRARKLDGEYEDDVLMARFLTDAP